ncbi:ATP-dependent helicase [Ghiorsea bivora]|uniref:ATP-dependent helicase n=1 Tax=Ghiorsea bivora TaxID=1485545 RepID=UPI00056EE39A|nr:UvrD-helicase domain-containing protein [Ghiorsea bivora]
MNEVTSNQLNEAQYRAVHYRGGPLLVLAGAGSGKTRVITERIGALVERDVPLDAITAVTFTNKAAKEMRERLELRLGEEKVKRLRICTFHALGLMMVREHAALVGRRQRLSIFAVNEQKSAMRSVLADLKLPTDADQVDRILTKISQMKNGMLESKDNVLSMVADKYDTLLQKMNAVDFDDLIVLPLRILNGDAEARALWQSRCRHFLVDEYQDSSRMQYDFVRLLAPGNANLTVVGDDDQSIYGWRGAEVRNLFQLERDYPSLEVIKLEENYRSTGAILQGSNSLIANNSERLGKKLRSNLGVGKPIRIWVAETSEDEAERVVAEIRSQRAVTQIKWDDCCILYRSSFKSRAFEMALREADIPYHVSGGLSFFDRAEVQDFLAYLKLIGNFSDDLALMRAISRPRRGIGSKALELLGQFAHEKQCSLLEAALEDGFQHAKANVLKAFGQMLVDIEHVFLHGEPDDAFDMLLERSGLEDAIRAEAEDENEAERRMGNIMSLRRWWLRHSENGGDLSSFLQHVFLAADDKDDDPQGQVRLMTVHAAKGLEFSHVFVVGMEDGGFPHKNAVAENRLEEERRLMYVAMTRARFRLTLSYAKSQRKFGQVEKMGPSPFLKEIDGDVLHWVDKTPDTEEGKMAAKEEVDAHMAAIREMLGLN